MAIAAISRVLEVKLGAVYEWVKKSGGRWGNDAKPAVGHSAGDFL